MLVRTVFVTALAGAIVAAPASADDIADEIRNALELYEAGKIAEAKEALDFAMQLLAQKKAAGLEAFLPEPLEGWQSEPGETMSAAGMWGGGVTASRSYTKGEEELSVTLVGDSPMMQAMTAMFANPAIAGAAGAKMQRIGRQRAIISPEGDVQVLAGKVLVTVSGRAPEATKLEYAAALDYEKLAAF